MKRFLFLIISVLSLYFAVAQPQKMTFQFVVRNANNELVANQQVGIQIYILEDNANGPIIYREVHSTTTNANALATIMIGEGYHPYPNTLADVQWGKHAHFLKIEIDPTGGTNYTISGTQQIATAPYAFFAETAAHVDTAIFAFNANHSLNAIYSDTTLYSYKTDTSLYANTSHSAIYADTALFLLNAKNSDTAKFSHHSDTAIFAANTLLSTYSDTALYSTNSNHSVYADTALYSRITDTSIFAFNANHSLNTTYSDTAFYSTNSNHSVYADTATYSHKSDTSVFAFNTNHSLTTTYSDTALYSYKTDTSLYSNTSHSAIYADTALFLMNAQNSDTAKFSHHSDTALYSFATNTAISANYADTTRIANYADSTQISSHAHTSEAANYADTTRIANSAITSNTANTANTANYADSTQISSHAHTSEAANYADTTRIANSAIISNTANTANYADSSDYNHLANRPAGTNRGDILYWEPNDFSWHVIPAGNIGEVLTMDSNNIPRWQHADTVALPHVVTDSVFNITTNTAHVGSTVIDDGGSAFVFSGICWGTSPNPTTTGIHTLDGVSLTSSTSFMTGLSMGTIYYVRAYAIGSAGTAYGNELTFRTQTYPTVTTDAISNISSTAAVSGGDVTDDGGAPITARGICWSTSPMPTIADSHTSEYIGTGTFTSNLTALNGNTTYYVRAYATNYIGTSYGNAVSFTTIGLPPTVTTTAASSITGTSAVTGGNVIDDGWVTVTERGICWNTTGNPTMADIVISSGNGTGSFSVNINGLTSLSKYYVRAYAINAIDTTYGAEVSFSTPWICGDTISDYDKNIYNTILIGSQCWMKENLRTTHYADGTAITLVTNTATSVSIAYMYYPDNDVNNVSTYGLLYNWYAAMNGNVSSSSNPSGVQGICPDGWHLPSDAEWTQLTDYVSSNSQYWCSGISTYIATAFASKTHWTQYSGSCLVGDNITNNNSLGFNALPAGYNHAGSPYQLGTAAAFWASTEQSSSHAYYRWLHNSDPNVMSGSNGYKYRGDSIRCIKD